MGDVGVLVGYFCRALLRLYPCKSDTVEYNSMQICMDTILSEQENWANKMMMMKMLLLMHNSDF